MAAWTKEQLAEAVPLAAAVGIREAARQTGIPISTISRNLSKTKSTEKGRQEIEAVGAQVKERAVQAAGDRLIRISDELYGLAEMAVGKIKTAISDPEELKQTPGKSGETHGRDGAAWLRSLVGVMSQAIDKAQLLAGKPTGRQEVQGQVTRREEHFIEQQLRADPEARELLKQLYRRNRSVESPSPD